MIRECDVFFIMHKDNLISKAIAGAMGFWASHSGIVKEVTRQGIYTVETTDFEVVIGDFNDYINGEQVEYEVWRLPIKPTEFARIREMSEAQRGKIYGYLQLFSFGVRRLLMKFGIKIPNFFRQGLVCCHVVTYGFKNSSLKEFADLDPESIDTKEMYDMIRTIAGAKLISTNRIVS
jgi:hypothetical protein